MAERIDVVAKRIFAKYLKTKGYDKIKSSSVVDLEADKGEKHYFFEIKSTKEATNYFGAATETEWNQAYSECTPGSNKIFYFVIVQKFTEEKEEKYRFKLFSPEDFLKISKKTTIPPFKVYFNIEPKNIEWEDTNLEFTEEICYGNGSKKERTSLEFNKDRFNRLHKFMDELRSEKINNNMKNILPFFFAVLLCSFAVASCVKPEEIENLQNQINEIKQENIASIESQIKAINSSITKLETTDKELKGYIETLQTQQDELVKADEALTKSIADLRTELLNKVSDEKAAILLLIEAYKSEVEGALSVINVQIAALQSKDENL